MIRILKKLFSTTNCGHAVLGVVFILLMFTMCSLGMTAHISHAEENITSEEGDSEEATSEYLETTEYPDDPTRFPDLVSQQAIVMDAKTGSILYQKNAFNKAYPASTTKMMTILMALESGIDMNKVMTMSHEAVYGIEPGSSSISLQEGEQITFEQGLYALMLESANEVALGLAEEMGQGDSSKFVEMMNKRAAELGCKNTHFMNPNGLFDENHYTTCYDMALITREALKYDELRKIASTEHYVIPPTNICEEERNLWMHCRMIYDSSSYYYEYFEGGKTGYTVLAKNTLITWSKKGDLELITVLMNCDGASKTYSDTKAIDNYCFNNYSYVNPLSDYTINSTDNSKACEYLINTLAIPEECISLSFDKDFSLAFNNNNSQSNINTSIEYLSTPVEATKNVYTVANIVLKYNNEVLVYVPVTASVDYSLKNATETSIDSDYDNVEVKPANEKTAVSKQISILQIILIIFLVVFFIVVVCVIYAIIVTKKREKKYEARRMQKKLSEQKKNGSSPSSGRPRPASNTAYRNANPTNKRTSDSSRSANK